MVTLLEIGKENKVSSYKPPCKILLVWKFLKVSRKSINKIYVQNKIVCKGETFEEQFAALELKVLSFLGNVNLEILSGYLLNFREFQYL